MLCRLMKAHPLKVMALAGTKTHYPILQTQDMPQLSAPDKLATCKDFAPDKAPCIKTDNPLLNYIIFLVTMK